MTNVGIMISEIPFANLPVLMKSAGLDYFILDYEHGGFDYSAMLSMISVARLAHLKCIIRLPNNQRKDIIKLMDMGADGLLLPMCNTADDIRQVVRYAMYRPIGERGLSTMRSHTQYNPPEIHAYTEQANCRTEVYAQIETKQGIGHIAEILAVEGVKGVFVGPNDLSDDCGCLGEKEPAEILNAIQTIGNAVKKAGKRAGIITGNQRFLSCAKENGFTEFCKGSELNAISEYCKKIIREIR